MTARLYKIFTVKQAICKNKQLVVGYMMQEMIILCKKFSACLHQLFCKYRVHSDIYI